MVDYIYDYFRGTRFVGEYVFVDVPLSESDKAVERAIIKEKLDSHVPITLEKKSGDRRQQQRDLRMEQEDVTKVPEDNHRYLIQLLNNPSKEYVILPTQMRRSRQALSKVTIKKYIKDVAIKEKFVGSPWYVKVFFD